MISELLPVLEVSTLEIMLLLGGLIACGLLLGVLERVSNRNIGCTFGWNGILATAWLGTPVHELGHALMALLFRHTITEVKLLNPDKNTGVLGYVSHSYNKSNPYQRVGNFFIALGPLFSGTFCLLFALFILLPNSFAVLVNGFLNTDFYSLTVTDFFNTLCTIAKQVYYSIFNTQNATSVAFWLFLLIAICVSSHIAMSTPDLKGMEDGLFAIAIIVFVINGLARLTGYEGLFANASKLLFINFYIIYVLLISLMFSALNCLLSMLLALIFRK